MLCDDCKEREASVHLTQIINNQKTEKHLCEKCAEQMGEINFSAGGNFSVQNLFKGMFSYNVPEVEEHYKGVTCPVCKMTYADFNRSGKMGCSACFDTYAEHLEVLLKRVHGTNSHSGKVPKRLGGRLALKKRLKQSKDRLKTCINREEYEEAAKIRDEIKRLEEELAG